MIFILNFPFNLLITIQVVGQNQPPRLIHIDQMPLTNAVLHESLRMSCTLYNALTHCAGSEFSINSELIPNLHPDKLVSNGPKNILSSPPSVKPFPADLHT